MANVTPAKAPAPRNRLDNLRQFQGVIRFDQANREFHVYRLSLGDITPAGFVPINDDPGRYDLGVVYLRNVPTPGFYMVKPRDLYRRRIAAQPSQLMSRDSALGLLGCDPSEFPESMGTDVGILTAAGDLSGEDAIAEELRAADVSFQEQIAAVQRDQDSEEIFF